MPFLYLGVQHFLQSWLFKIPAAECPGTDKSKSLVTPEYLFSSGCINIPFFVAFLVLMNMFSLLLLCCFVSQGWEEAWTDMWWQLISLRQVYSLPLLMTFAKFTLFYFSPFCRSPHFHGVTIKRPILMGHTVKHFQSTNIIESKIWWEHVSSWLVSRFQSNWYLPWWIYSCFTWIETLALHTCAWSRHKLLAGFWHSVNLF